MYLSHRWGVWGRAKGLDFEPFHEQAGNEGAEGGTHGSTMDMFIILTLEEDVCLLRENSRMVIICGMDMLVLCERSGSCCNFVTLC